jgi:malate dehydrogenase (quinone)
MHDQGVIRHFRVAIIGVGGVTGSAVAWILSLFTNVGSILGLEKYGRPGMVNSNPLNNAQTRHDGGTETNYSLPKAIRVLRAALSLTAYVLLRKDKEGLFHVSDRMVVGVGKKQVGKLRARLKEFQHFYPDLRLVEAKELGEIEPKVMEGRNPKQPIVALVSNEGYAINYQLLAECFLEDAQRANPKLRVCFDTEATKITRRNDGVYLIHTNSGVFSANVLVPTAGAYSLLHAQRLGYGLKLGILSVAGSFFSLPKDWIRGKIYRPQVDSRPFAEPHFDLDLVTGVGRGGPLTEPKPVMENYRWGTFKDYAELSSFSLQGALVGLWILISNGLVFYVLMNYLYKVPVIGKWLFLKKAQQTLPSLRYRDITLRKGTGGIRPQIIDLDTWEMEMGERTVTGNDMVKIEDGATFTDHLVAITTPSPGASKCIDNAAFSIVPIIIRLLNQIFGDGSFRMDQTAFERHLGLDQNLRYREVCATIAIEDKLHQTRNAA